MWLLWRATDLLGLLGWIFKEKAKGGKEDFEGFIFRRELQKRTRKSWTGITALCSFATSLQPWSFTAAPALGLTNTFVALQSPAFLV